MDYLDKTSRSKRDKLNSPVDPIQMEKFSNKVPYQFFPCNFYKRRIYPPKPPEF